MRQPFRAVKACWRVLASELVERESYVGKMFNELPEVGGQSYEGPDSFHIGWRGEISEGLEGAGASPLGETTCSRNSMEWQDRA